MSSMDMLKVSVVYADKDNIWHKSLNVCPGATVGEAISNSGFYEAHPSLSTQSISVGIYGQRIELSRKLSQHDRIEIYRELIFDPMESRRRRAIHRQRNKKKT